MTINELKNTLNDIYVGLCKTGRYKEAHQEMMKLEPVRLANAMLNPHNEMTQDQIEVLKLFVLNIQAIFENSGEPEMLLDETYNRLYDLYVAKSGEELVGSEIVNSGDKVNHKFTNLRGTLRKIYFVLDSDRIKPQDKDRHTLQWYQRFCENLLGKTFKDLNVQYLMSIKWDGVSGNVDCDEFGNPERVLPRGFVSGNETKDIMPLFKGVKNFNFKHLAQDNKRKFGVKNEMLVSEEFLTWLNSHGYNYIDGRAAISGMTNSLDTPKDLLERITLKNLRVQYEGTTREDYVYNDGDPYLIVDFDDFDQIKKNIQILKEEAADQGLAADGVVFTIINPELQEALGRDESVGVNKFEIAYKFPPEEKHTIVDDIEWSVGPSGQVTPVVKVKPVIMKRKTIKSINIGSYARFKELKLKIFDEVILQYDIIPYLAENLDIDSEGELFKAPTHCIYCGEELERTSHLKCINENCKCRIQGKILNYINKMEILGMAESTVEQLFELGYLNSISDLYKLDRFKNDIIQLDGWGELSYINMVESINKRRVVKDNVLLGSLGIQGTGRRTFETILKVMDFDDLVDKVERMDKNLVNELRSIKGIGDKTSKSIVQGLSVNYNLLEELLTYMRIEKTPKEDLSKPITGYMCFTNVRDKEFEKKLEELGYKIQSSVNSKTNFLVALGESGKTEKARLLGVPIYRLDEAKRMFD